MRVALMVVLFALLSVGAVRAQPWMWVRAARSPNLPIVVNAPGPIQVNVAGPYQIGRP